MELTSKHIAQALAVDYKQFNPAVMGSHINQIYPACAPQDC